MSSNRRFRGRVVNTGRETYEPKDTVATPKISLEANETPQISLETKETSQISLTDPTNEKGVESSIDNKVVESVPEKESKVVEPSSEKQGKVVEPVPEKESKAATLTRLITTNLIHDKASLPEKYKEMLFNYKFMDVVKHGDAHSLRGKLTIDLAQYQSTLKTPPPSSYSLKSHVGHILNQGSLGACVSHSAVQALYIVMNKVETSRWSLSRYLSSNSAFYASRLYIYYNSRLLDGSSAYEDNGCTNISACISLSEYKACNEKEWPYDPTRFSVKPPHQAYLDAGSFRNFKYSVVKQTATDLKHAIAGGHPVMIGIVVFPSFIHSGLNGGSGVWNGPHSSESPIGGHSLLVVGYDDEKQLFTIVNHWGSEWGTDGYGFISYNYLENSDYSGDFCAIETFA